MKWNAADNYEDMIHMAHHVSVTRPRMAVSDRAAQFSPFAALTGYDDAIEETARQTEEWINLDECKQDMINEKLQMIQEHMEESPRVTLTYFQPDRVKTGGSYLTLTGNVKKIDIYEKYIIMSDERKIPIEAIFEIEEN